MVNVTLNREQLFKDLGIADSKEVLEKFAELGIEIEEENEKEIVIGVTANRPDLLSQQGFTRALAAFLGLKPGLRNYATTPSKLKVYVDEIMREVRPYTACAVVRNIALNEEKLKEIIDIQEKLHTTFCRRRKKAAIGVYPMDAIHGNITFTALTPDKIKFQPLEADHEMTANEILTEHPKGKEYAHLLEGMKQYPLFLDNKKNVLSMPPVINSHNTGKVTTQTKELFIESSGFDQRTCQEIVQILCAALADMGASIYTVDVQYSKRTDTTPDMAPKRQEFYGYYVNRRLGVTITKDQFTPLLAKMGLGFEEGRIKDTFYALIPAYRTDFLHQIDVVEDLAIAYGYNNITAALPNVVTVANESRTSKFERIIRHILVGQGLLEAKNYHLTSRQLQIDIGEATDICTLKSSVSEGYDSLRRSLLPPMLAMLVRNKKHEYPQRFFEIGTIFTPEPMQEKRQLCIALAGEDYTRARQAVDGLLAGLGIVTTYERTDDVRFHKGRCARILFDGREIGVVGEIAPRVLANINLPVVVAAAEIDMSLLSTL